MGVMISMLRGVNLAGNSRMKMEELRAVYEGLGLRGAQTYVQSGNVVFRTADRNLVTLRRRIEDGIERGFGFRPDVILRTPAEMQSVVARNPFAKQAGIEPAKLLVTFLADLPCQEACERVRAMKPHPEELRLDGRELYIYYPNGMGTSKLAWMAIVKALKTTGTGRNWNSVTQLLEMAVRLGER